MDDLGVFQELLGGLVLYVDPTLTEAGEYAVPVMAGSPDNPNVFLFGNRRCDDFSELSEWLTASSTPKRGAGAVDPEKVIKFVIESLAVKNEQELLASVAELFAIPFTAGSPSPRWWDVLYVLNQVAASYDKLEHDILRYARHSLSQNPENLAKLQQKREMLNTASDLWKSVKASPAYHQVLPSGKVQQILLVDDNPEGIGDELKKIIKTFISKDCELWCWNPAKEERAFRFLYSYNSMTGLEESPLIAKADKLGADVPSTKKAVSQILEKCHFVLVDVLFHIEGEEHDYGAELIRGLRRYCSDRLSQSEAGSGFVPRFVAFSRSDDLEKIQKALRSGASGYVLKNRLLSLPAELARLLPGTGQDIFQLHRNFHALDFLPNETRGLIHELEIPRIPFDRQKNPESGGNVAAMKPDSPQAQSMAALLRAIPKPDLHLHAGSCMTPEYLVVASLVMLAERPDVIKQLPPLFSFWSGNANLVTLFRKNGGYQFDLSGATKSSIDPVAILGSIIRKDLKVALIKQARRRTAASGSAKNGIDENSLRSILHDQLGIRDYWPVSRASAELDSKDAVTLMLFALSVGMININGHDGITLQGLDKRDILRLFILFMAAQYEGGVINYIGNGGETESVDSSPDIIKILAELVKEPVKPEMLTALGAELTKIHNWADRESKNIREGKYDEAGEGFPLEVSLAAPGNDLLKTCPSFSESPLEFLIASGTRSRTLAEYLAGCEYAGAEHLQRACLMRLYARQTLEYLVRHGVLYAELRSAVSGYASRGHLTYQEAYEIFQRSFSEEQKAMMKGYRNAQAKAPEPVRAVDAKAGWLWCSKRTTGGSMWESLFSSHSGNSLMGRYFPAKVNLIFTGKRHKATREMVMEAAAGVMLSSDTGDKAITANDFTRQNMESCRFVGFDLAGPEEPFPPEMFRNSFDQLSHMHIPITAHAGENASSQFVESAVLDLRARRLGHGLALADDPKLMGRVREERICIELCPVSNYQTNEFVGAESGKPGRIYPLKKFLDNGNIVCLNTDNPIVSYTNIVKEFFQASYAYGKEGLSLWNALRMIRMGFAHAFKSLAERRAILELVEQMIFDLLIDRDVENLLRRIAQDQASAGT